MAKVFIGVGHGGKDPGAVSGNFKESAINLQVALGMAQELERHGVFVGISREVEEDDPLTEEIKEANAFAPDVAVECHNNAGGGDGFEVYRQTSSKYGAESLKLAKAIESRVKSIGQNSRGVKTKLNSSGTDYFGWCRQVNAPAVLCEGFFVDNVKDRTDFSSVAEQRALGVAYAHGVLDYLGIKVIADNGLQPDTDSPSTDGGKMYAVQVGAWGNKSLAEDFCKQLNSKNFEVKGVKLKGFVVEKLV